MHASTFVKFLVTEKHTAVNATNCQLDRGVTSDTLAPVKTISIKQLHARTGHWVRAARQIPLIVTDRGEKIATLQPLASTVAAPKFPKRDWSKLPSSDLDSTDLISADRDGR